MSTKNSRAMISLPPEWEPEILKVKKDIFYNDSQAEMYRHLIRLGLDELIKEEAKNEQTKTA
ncbi:MAG: hypothetical protein ACK5L3_04900 [Oscillospiraceae bacterium]